MTPQLSLVVPCFDEAAVIERFHSSVDVVLASDTQRSAGTSARSPHGRGPEAPPELIPQMLELHQRGYDQVITRRDREGESAARSSWS